MHVIPSSAWAEIISKRKQREKWEFYVHYCNCEYNNPVAFTLILLVYAILVHASSVNKRLDEWVPEDLLDVDRLQLPRKDSKVSTLSKSSRPASPDVSTLNCEPKRHNSVTGRKKIKLDSAEVSDVVLDCC